jgi:methylglutaconyl-CoA hydratase
MSPFQTIRVDIDTRGVATLFLDRPDKHNAMDAVMIREIAAAAEALAVDATVRIVVLASGGRSFCAGGDLAWMRAQSEADRSGKIAESMALATALSTLDALPKPVIARVHGAAYGGGIGLMAVSDLVIASDAARFCLTETRLGLIPANIGPYVVRRIGEGHAREIFLNGRVFDAVEGRRLGLVTRVVDASGLDAAVEEEVALLLECAPGAIADAKLLAIDLARQSLDDPRDFTAARLADRWESDEARAGIAAFFARVRPPWAPKQG